MRLLGLNTGTNQLFNQSFSELGFRFLFLIEGCLRQKQSSSSSLHCASVCVCVFCCCCYCKAPCAPALCGRWALQKSSLLVVVFLLLYLLASATDEFCFLLLGTFLNYPTSRKSISVGPKPQRIRASPKIAAHSRGQRRRIVHFRGEPKRAKTGCCRKKDFSVTAARPQSLIDRRLVVCFRGERKQPASADVPWFWATFGDRSVLVGLHRFRPPNGSEVMTQGARSRTVGLG